jgi:hypothetical protein
MASFADLLTERGLNIKTLELSAVDKIPDDCAVLIINNPQRILRPIPTSTEITPIYPMRRR